ncbi:MAG: M28 family peptidase [Gammaproteobacteria bacterium]|nr:M28 family peptidase [Gammaproteobacteria bacterium]
MLRRLRRRRWGVICGYLFLCACAGEPRHAVPPSVFTDEGFRAQVRVLASDQFAGRRPGTPGAQKTVDYLVAQFQRFGLKPGNGSSYLQQVPIVEVTAAADASLSFTAPDGASRALRYAKDMIVWSPREVATSLLVHSPVVFVGYGIDAPAHAWNDYAGADVRGKTVIVLSGAPPGQPWAGRYGRPAYKFDEAARHGATGVLLARHAGAAGEDWEAIVNRDVGGILQAPAPASPDRPWIEGWLRSDAAGRLLAGAGSSVAAVAARAGRPGFRAEPLGLYADAQVHSQIRRFTSPNVVALLPGRRYKREYVVYTAHWDHLGRAGPDRRGPVLHGAVDNASGVAGLLLLAQSFARAEPPPDRSIVFIAPTAAEYGRLGSAYYVEHPTFPLPDTVADINLGMLRIGGPTRDIAATMFGQSQMDVYLQNAADLQGRVVRTEPEPWRGLYYRSDAMNFARVGVPTLYAGGGLDDAAMGPRWGRERMDGYFAHRYRQVGDRYLPSWNVRGTLQDLQLYFDVGRRLAATRKFPDWNSNSEFHGVPARAAD